MQKDSIGYEDDRIVLGMKMIGKPAGEEDLEPGGGYSLYIPVATIW
jgi:hypothetical protein